MDQGLKERLVGAAVLVAIAVWLIPWVLDGPEDGVETSASSLRLPAAEEPMPMRTEILRLGEPAESSVEPTPRPAAASPAPEVAATEAPRNETEPQAEESRAADTTVAAVRPEPEPPAPTPPPRTAPSAPKTSAAAATTAAGGDWAVQLGSFGDEANARRMAQRAGTYGYKAEVSSYKSGARTLYRVRVGPQATRGAADAAASALRAHGIKDASVVAAR